MVAAQQDDVFALFQQRCGIPAGAGVYLAAGLVDLFQHWGVGSGIVPLFLGADDGEGLLAPWVVVGTQGVAGVGADAVFPRPGVVEIVEIQLGRGFANGIGAFGCAVPVRGGDVPADGIYDSFGFLQRVGEAEIAAVVYPGGRGVEGLFRCRIIHAASV